MQKDKLFTNNFFYACLGNFLLFFGFFLLMAVMPLYLIETFHAPKSMVGLVLAGYTLSALVIRPFSGFLLDMFERKPVFLMAYGVFVLFFIGYPLAGTLTMFALLRMLHGLEFGVVSTANNTIVVDIMPASRRGEGLGYFGVSSNLAMAFGPMLAYSYTK